MSGLHEVIERLADQWEANAGGDRDNESRTLREVASYLRRALATYPPVREHVIKVMDCNAADFHADAHVWDFGSGEHFVCFGRGDHRADCPANFSDRPDRCRCKYLALFDPENGPREVQHQGDCK